MHCAHQFDASIDLVFSLVLTKCYHNVLTITFAFTQSPEAPHVSGLYFERFFPAFDSVDESAKLVHLDILDLMGNRYPIRTLIFTHHTSMCFDKWHTY
jgi:hypothetical protein